MTTRPERCNLDDATWARLNGRVQREIERLCLDLDARDRKFEEIVGASANTRLFLDHFVHTRMIGIPMGSTMKYLAGDRARFTSEQQNYLEARLDPHNGGLLVRSDSPIIVLPHVSNQITVCLKPTGIRGGVNA